MSNQTKTTKEEIVIGPEPLAPRIIEVEAEDASIVRMSFEAGETRLFDVSPLFSRGVFQRIAEPNAFYSVSVVEGGGGIEWEVGPDCLRIGSTTTARQ